MAITRFKNSSIRNRTPKYNDVLAGLPFRPIIGTASDGGTGTTVSVAFTGNNPAGAGITYTALSSPGSITATGPASPITVSGLTAGTAYTFQVKAGNSLGDSAYSGSSNSVTPVTPTAFESIATGTSNGFVTQINLTSIPGTYQHLQLRGFFKAGSTTNLGINFNSVGTNVYDYHTLNGNGATASATGNATQNEIIPGSSVIASNVYTVFIMDIHDYASTTKNKTVRIFLGVDDNSGTTGSYVRLSSGLWRSTSAITSINLFDMGANNFANQTTFALYGIRGA